MRNLFTYNFTMQKITFPKHLENLLKRYLKETFYVSTRREVFRDRDFTPQDLKFFSQGAKTLSELFTSEREDLSPNYLNDKKLRAGYLFYFLPLNFGKAQSVLQKLPPSFYKKNKWKILDLGCGPGTFSLALVDYLIQLGKGKNERLEIDILSLDQNYHVLKDALFLHEELAKFLRSKGYSIRISLNSRTFDLRRGKPDTLLKNEQYDLIVASHFMNEWKHSKGEEKVRFLEKIYQRHLSSEGFLVLIDPALQKPSRELQEIRDIILEKKSLYLFSPCLHQKPCPMLAATSRDWCHFYADWEEPEFMKALDRILKNKNEFLKYSYMIFSPKNLNEADLFSQKAEKTHLYRVVSNQMKTNGKVEALVCGPAGRWHLTRLDKNKSPSNQDLGEIRRGDLVYLPKIPLRPFQNSGDLKIEKEDKVKKI